MIVKDSTTNQVHNDSTQKKQLLKRLRSDASGSGVPERTLPVEKTSQIHDRRGCQRLTHHHRGVVSDFLSYFLVMSFFKNKQKRKIAIIKRKISGSFFFFRVSMINTTFSLDNILVQI